jgi:hypothetical protein
VGSPECSSNGGVDVTSADIGNGVQNNGKSEAVADGSRAQAVLSGIGNAGSTEKLKQERSNKFCHHTLDGLMGDSHSGSGHCCTNDLFVHACAWKIVALFLPLLILGSLDRYTRRLCLCAAAQPRQLSSLR